MTRVIPYVDYIFIIMRCNSTSHAVQHTVNMLEKDIMQRMVWLACSSDLSPFESLWNKFYIHVYFGFTNLGDCISLKYENKFSKPHRQYARKSLECYKGSYVILKIFHYFKTIIFAIYSCASRVLASFLFVFGIILNH